MLPLAVSVLGLLAVVIGGGGLLHGLGFTIVVDLEPTWLAGYYIALLIGGVVTIFGIVPSLAR